VRTKGSFKERVHYLVDNYLARGNKALFISLVAGFLGAIFGIVLLRVILHAIWPDPVNGFNAHLWKTFLELTDPGNMNQDNNTPTLFKITAVIAGLSGVVIFSALIAVLTTALDGAIANFKKGHSRVLESEHSIILGWGDRVVEILKELVEANESEDDPCVVILSELPKEEMDEFLLTNFPDSGNTRVVTRTGAVTSLLSLNQISASECRSAIVLASCKESDLLADRLDSDARVIKSVLALEAIAPEAEFPIVTEVFNKRNAAVVKDISPERVRIVDAGEVLAKIMVQTSRTSGLSVVYSELLSFDGCEMYFHHDDWGGIQWQKLQYHFPDGVPIGLRTADGEIRMRPALDYELADDDEILIVADDDSTIEFLPEPVMVPEGYVAPGHRTEQKKERKLIIGWSPKAPVIISEYSEYVLEDSEVVVIANDPPDWCRRHDQRARRGDRRDQGQPARDRPARRPGPRIGEAVRLQQHRDHPAEPGARQRRRAHRLRDDRDLAAAARDASPARGRRRKAPHQDHHRGARVEQPVAREPGRGRRLRHLEPDDLDDLRPDQRGARHRGRLRRPLPGRRLRDLREARRALLQ